MKLVPLVACVCGSRLADRGADAARRRPRARAGARKAGARGRSSRAGGLQALLDSALGRALDRGALRRRDADARARAARAAVGACRGGSTFFNTLLSHACPERPTPSLRAGALPSVAERCATTRARPRAAAARRAARRSRATARRARACSSRWADARAGDARAARGGGEPPGELVGLFRLPDQRLLSAFCYGLHAWSMRNAMRRRMAASVPAPAAFARYPGVRGCATKCCSARTAARCSGSTATRSARARAAAAARAASRRRPRTGRGSRRGAALAAARVRRLSRASSAWSASVYLFHRLYGGAVRDAELEHTLSTQAHAASRRAYRAVVPPRDAAAAAGRARRRRAAAAAVERRCRRRRRAGAGAGAGRAALRRLRGRARARGAALGAVGDEAEARVLRGTRPRSTASKPTSAASRPRCGRPRHGRLRARRARAAAVLARRARRARGRARRRRGAAAARRRRRRAATTPRADRARARAFLASRARARARATWVGGGSGPRALCFCVSDVRRCGSRSSASTRRVREPRERVR